MNEATARVLAAINRIFYRERAAEWSATRAAPWPGWARLLPALRARAAAGPVRVLDAGCGNGRLAHSLADALPRAELLVEGVDQSEPLLALAREGAPPGARFACADFSAHPEALPAGPFDLVALFGVVHGVPGRARRGALVEACARRVAPGGRLAFTIWRIEPRARERGRLVDWAAHASRTGQSIDTAQLEPGDHLIAWGEGGDAVRYFHVFEEPELEALAARAGAAGLAPDARYRADGRSGDLNEYLVFRAP